jgi:hypothetical protein
MIERTKDLAGISLNPSTAVAVQNSNLEQCNGTDGERLTAPLQFIEDSRLFAGELLRLGQPPYRNVRVEQVSKHKFR